MLKTPFTQIPNFIIENSNISPNAKIVYLCIAKCMPSAFPSYPLIMGWTGFCRDSVVRALKELEQSNLIKRFKIGRGRQYSLVGFKEIKLSGAQRVCFTDGSKGDDQSVLSPPSVCSTDLNQSVLSDANKTKEQDINNKNYRFLRIKELKNCNMREVALESIKSMLARSISKEKI